MTVLDFDPARRTNAQAIFDLARLGILLPGDYTLDTTIGPEAGFWKEWKPTHVVTNDLDPGVVAHHHWDARSLPIHDAAFDVVVFDPPYANRGTSRLAMDATYGIGKYRTRKVIEQLIIDGTTEALRVCSRLAIVKCQDACVGSHYRPQTFLVWEAARAVGAEVVGELYVVGNRKQPTGKRQLNVWSNCSTMMVLAV